MSLLPSACFQYFTYSVIFSFVTVFCLQAAGNLKTQFKLQNCTKNQATRREIVLAGTAGSLARMELAIGPLGHVWSLFLYVLILALPLSTADILRLITRVGGFPGATGPP